MPFELQARTAAGARLVALAEALAADFATRAAEHDREASYPFEDVDALREARYFVAPVPEELGGLGVTSVHDVLVASSRLARGDASVAIGVNMHLISVLAIVRRWQMARAAGDQRRTRAFAASLRSIVDEGAVMAGATSERNQDITRPATTATRTETGWRIDGAKVFCTMSPAATVLHTAVTFVDDGGVERYAYVPIPVDAPGVTVNDDWDAMGMRASGSHSVTLDGVELPREAVRGGFRAGDAVAYMERNLDAGLFHASASLGIAENAVEVALGAIRRNGGAAGDARVRMLAAESAIELSAVRAAFSRAASLIDEHYASHPTEHGTPEELTALFAEIQGAKAFVNEGSARAVDHALALSGGAGYLNGHPLGRAYRDVRAGSFMHPLGANRAYELVGQVALGLEPALH